jgi:hypothetical protein
MLNALALGDKRSLVPVDRFSRLATQCQPGKADRHSTIDAFTVRPGTAKICIGSANQRNSTPSKRQCESGMKVFSTRTLYFMGFYARELSVFFFKKNSRRTRRAKPSGFAAPTQGQNPQQYES